MNIEELRTLIEEIKNYIQSEKVSVEEVKKLVELMDEHGLDEIEVKTLFSGIRIVKNRPAPQILQPAPVVKEQPEPAPAKEEGKVESGEKLHEIKSPIVGTFYRRPYPGADPYVKEGDHVTKGQVLCIVEAMKIMNEIESDVDGTIVKIVPEDATPVGYGDTLFLIKPD